MVQKAKRRGKSSTPLSFLCTAPDNYPNDWNRLRLNLYFNLSSEIPKQSPLLKDDKCTLSSSVHLSTLLPWPAVIEKKKTHSATYMILKQRRFRATHSLRSKRFQSSYGAKVRVGRAKTYVPLVVDFSRRHPNGKLAHGLFAL